MTMNDYADLGIVPPRQFEGYRPGSVFKASQQRHATGQQRPAIIDQ